MRPEQEAVDVLLDRLVLERIGPADATVGLISLPLPRHLAGRVHIEHPRSTMQPVAWWERQKLPRRSMAFVVDDRGVPDELALREGARACPGSAGWTIDTRISKEKLGFTPRSFSNIHQLRGVPADECTTVEFELLLNYGDRTLVLQFGATGPQGGPYYWQNVQIDTLWQSSVAEAVRAGGIIYNEDTYLWADVYLVLFSNGVAHAAAHFVNTKLHIEGYDFRGLPLIRFAGDGLRPIEASVPKEGPLFDLGLAQFNASDASILCSEKHPGQLTASDAGVLWYPVARTFNPQVREAPETLWAPGFARTVRFQISLSEAKPVVARYRVPAWWYSVSDEPWPGQYLPVKGRYADVSGHTCEHVRSEMVRGRFDGGSADFANDGYAGTGLMTNYYLSGDAELLADALDYCYYWADLAVDHRDYTVHQWVGGWGWKTCAYLKFRDILYGYLETGDPYLLDTFEMCAEAYWMWFRSNWPRCAMGRDSFEFGAWALLWRYLRTEHGRERIGDLVRMMREVLQTRGTIGGQMGAGPHPGYHSSLYMTGVGMTTLLEVGEAELEEGDRAGIELLLEMLGKLHDHFVRDDVELFPSNFGEDRKRWKPRSHGVWAMLAVRIYPQMARLRGEEDEASRCGLRLAYQSAMKDHKEWAASGRPGHCFVNPLYHDALLLGARLKDAGIEIAPLGEPSQWPPEQLVDTPFGELRVACTPKRDGAVLKFSAQEDFPITVRHRGEGRSCSSKGTCEVGNT